MSIRVILADDHRIVREGLRGLLQKLPDMEVIAEAEDGRNTVKLVQEMSPDVVIMDVTMPDMNGIEATRQIVGASPAVKVIALSMHADRRFVTGMLNAGARGYLLKNCALEELAQAIRRVVSGHSYLSPTIVDVVVPTVGQPPEKTEGPGLDTLTTREREVLQLLAEGRSVKEIAAHLTLSIKTIETYRQQIMNKLDIHTIAELTKYAIREGIISLDT